MSIAILDTFNLIEFSLASYSMSVSSIRCKNQTRGNIEIAFTIMKDLKKGLGILLQPGNVHQALEGRFMAKVLLLAIRQI